MPRGPSVRALMAATVIMSAVPAIALAHRASTETKLVGNPAAGKPLFVSTCGLCHKLKDAKTAGTIGPDLDKVSLTQPMIVKAITYGGSAVMTKMQVAKYPTQMVAYKNVLSRKQIQDIAAYVFKASHPALYVSTTP